MARMFYACMRKSSDEQNSDDICTCTGRMYGSQDKAKADCPEDYEVVELVAMTIPEWEKLIKDNI